MKKNTQIHSLDCRCQSGFSFVEVMVASGILILGIFLLLWIESNKWQSIQSSQNVNKAIQYCEQRIESLRYKVKLNPILNYPPPASDTTIGAIRYKTVVDSARDSIGVSVKRVADVKIIASWKKSAGGMDSLVIRTYIALQI